MRLHGLFRAGCLCAMAALPAAHGGPAAAGDLGRSEPSIFDKIGSLRPGDFDRPMPPVLDGLLPKQLTLGPVTRVPGDPLTDAEEELRNRAYDLIRLPQRREEWKLILASARVAKALPPSVLWFDRKAYGSMLVGLPFRSEAGRYGRLLDDVASDMMLVGPFVVVACYVTDMDIRRGRSLAHVEGLTEWERDDALGRITENRMVIDWVRHSLQERHWSYRYAVERLVIASPSPAAVEAERLIERFRLQIADVQAQLAHCAGAQLVHRLITK
jgi:hypothetical protein